jgi:hypothetical protein
MAKRATSYRLSDKAVEMLTKLSDHYGFSRASVLEMLVRAEARRVLIPTRLRVR